MRIIRTLLLLVVAVGLGFSTQGCEGYGPPNIILIVIDDWGYHDNGFQGGLVNVTPNLDWLAANGVTCTSGYVSCPVCSPTRAGLMTGRYQQRFGHENNPGSATAFPTFRLSPNEITLPELLKTGGYATGMFGKWHLSNNVIGHPMNRGFDTFFGFQGGAHSYYNALPASDNPFWDDFTIPAQIGGYATNVFGARATSFVEAHAGEPFFLYMPFNAVHTPLDTPPGYSGPTTNRAKMLAMLQSADSAVGSVLNKVWELGLQYNTLIFLIADNGGPETVNGSDNGPLRGVKAQTYEGGIRVPFVVHWYGVLPGGTFYDHPVIALDILPTALSAAGVPLPGDRVYDGVDLLPFIGGVDPNPPHDMLVWRYRSNAGSGAWRAARFGDWKIVRQGTGAWQLYHLASDIGETTNYASTFPQFRDQLVAAFQAFNQQNFIPPLW